MTTRDPKKPQPIPKSIFVRVDDLYPCSRNRSAAFVNTPVMNAFSKIIAGRLSIVPIILK